MVSDQPSPAVQCRASVCRKKVVALIDCSEETCFRSSAKSESAYGVLLAKELKVRENAD
jgi:hypothetical protein